MLVKLTIGEYLIKNNNFFYFFTTFIILNWTAPSSCLGCVRSPPRTTSAPCPFPPALPSLPFLLPTGKVQMSLVIFSGLSAILERSKYFSEGIMVIFGQWEGNVIRNFRKLLIYDNEKIPYSGTSHTCFYCVPLAYAPFRFSQSAQLRLCPDGRPRSTPALPPPPLLPPPRSCLHSRIPSDQNLAPMKFVQQQGRQYRTSATTPLYTPPPSFPVNQIAV